MNPLGGMPHNHPMRSPRRNTSPADAASWLLAIVVLAVAIPANDKIGQNAVFFAAHGISPIAWAVVLLVGLAVVWLLLAGILRLVKRKASPKAFDVTATIVTALIAWFLVGNALALTLLSAIPWLAIPVGLAISALVTWLARRFTMGNALLVFAGIAAAIPIIGTVTGGSQAPTASGFAFQEMANRPNVVWVIADELQYPLVMTRNGEVRAEFPNLKSLQETATTYTRAYSAANYTDYAVPSMLTGIADVSAETPERMQQVRSNIGIIPGFAGTYSIVTESPLYRYECNDTECASIGAQADANPITRYLNFAKDTAAIAGRTALAAPFSEAFPSLDGRWRDFWSGGEEFGVDTQGDTAPRAIASIDAATKAGAAADGSPSKPVFALWHTIRTHAPWNIDREGRAIFPFRVPIVDGAHMFGAQADQTYSTDDLKQIERRLYANTAVEFDRELGTVIDDLKAKGLFDNSMVIVTADHGATLTERADRRVGDNDIQRWSEVAHVPLIVKAPNQTTPQIVTEPRSTGQIAATVAKTTGAEVPTDLPLAKPLDQSLDKGPVFSIVAGGKATPFVHDGTEEVDPWTSAMLTPPDPQHPFAVGIDPAIIGKPVPEGYTELIGASITRLPGESAQVALVVDGGNCSNHATPGLVVVKGSVVGSLLWTGDGSRGWAIVPAADDYSFVCAVVDGT